MATRNKVLRLKKMEQRRKAMEVSNPKLAKKMEGKIEAVKGMKDI